MMSRINAAQRLTTRIFIPVICALLLFGGTDARATIVTYSSLSAYEAATSGNTTVDFTGIAPAGAFVTEVVPPGLAVGGVNFTIDQTTSDGALYVVDSAFANNFTGATILDAQFSTQSNENIVITLPYAVSGVAFNIASPFNSETVTIALSAGGSTTTTTAGSNQLGFFGFTSDTPFTSLELSQSIGDAITLSDFTFARSVSATPAPAAFPLFVSGLGAFGLLHWRKKWKVAARAA